MVRNILEIQQSDSKPVISELPPTIWHKWAEFPTLRQLYEPAFEIEDPDEGELYFSQLLIWRANREFAQGTLRRWHEIAATERTEMAWYALAVDASALNCCKRGLPPTLTKARALYGANLPERLGIGQRRLDVKAQAIKDRAEARGEPMTDFEARVKSAKVQKRKRDDARRDNGGLFDA